MKRFPVAYLLLPLLITGIAFVILHYAISRYLINQTKEEVQSILLSHRGFHVYIQKDLHPAFYDGLATGAIAEDFYDPRILSSSYISRVMHRYFNEERKRAGLDEVYYKMAANNPRNPVNKADEAEKLLIRKFNTDRDYKEYQEIVTVNGRRTLFYAIPFLKNDKPCLRCHGNPEDAPPGLRLRYPGDGGFHEKPGEIRAIESIRIPLQEEAFSALKISGALVTGLFVTLFLFFFNARLRQRVREKSDLLESEARERRKISDQLAAAHRQTLVILDNLAALVYVADMQTYELLFVNAYGRRIWGEVQGKICWQVLQNGQDGPCPFCTNNRLLDQDGKPAGVYAWEVQNTLTGAWFDCRDQAVPWLDGRLVRVEIATDITERKKAESELLKERDKAQRYFDIAGVMFTVLDAEGRVALMNPKGCEILGYAQEEIIGIDWFGRLLPERLRDEVTGVFRRLMAGEIEPVEYFENPVMRKDGEERLIAFHNTVIRDDTGKITGILFSGEDITERQQQAEKLRGLADNLEKQVLERTLDLDQTQSALLNMLDDMNLAKDQLEAANTRLKELDRLKSMFIASMSHELRTPLNSIIGFSGIMLQGMAGELNGEQKDQLERVFRAGKHLLALITDVIDIAKIESGKIQPYAEEFVLQDVVHEACESLKVQLKDKGLELRADLPAAPVHMNTDRRRLLQCLLNYLGNAVKFTERGSVAVTFREEGERVTVSVADTGIGIKASNIGLLFTSFVRLDSALKMTTTGTGLGLYLTKKLVTEVLGGEVAVESTEGAGSTFSLTIPRILPDQEQQIG